MITERTEVRGQKPQHPELAVDQSIPQPGGVIVKIEGVPSNLRIICKTPNGSFPFSAVMPDRTTFSIVDPNHEDGYESYTREGKREISIPHDRTLLEHIPVFGILHEGGHVWQSSDNAWHEIITEARAGLAFLGFIFGNSLTGHDETDKELIEFSKIAGEAERRASAIALYIIGRLRSIGLDPIPQYQTANSLADMVNSELKTHERFDTKLEFTEDEVASFLAGNIPFESLGELVKRHLDQVLHTIKN